MPSYKGNETYGIILARPPFFRQASAMILVESLSIGPFVSALELQGFPKLVTAGSHVTRDLPPSRLRDVLSRQEARRIK